MKIAISRIVIILFGQTITVKSHEDVLQALESVNHSTCYLFLCSTQQKWVVVYTYKK